MASTSPQSLRLAVAAFLVVPLACTSTPNSVAPFHDASQAAAIESCAEQRCVQSLEGGRRVPSRRFRSDGCSLWFDGDWAACCVQHDLVYWCGGTAEERKRADASLRECVAARAPSWFAGLTYLGVRVGGHPLFPVPYRWGYGRSYWPFYAEFPASTDSGEAR